MYTSPGQILFILTVSALIVGGLIGYFLYSMVRHIRQYQRQQEQYNRSKLEALERERQVISADLHDDIGPMLSATLYKLGAVHPLPEREKELLVQVQEHIRSVFSRIREMSVMLVPRAIEKKGPLYALDEFAGNYLNGQPLKVEISVMSCPGLSGEQSLQLFRMLQEILHNTVKHAGASRLEVSARIENEVLHIETRDDGKGFEPAAVREKPGLGLQHLSVRARMIGARLSCNSWPGKGTCYSIDIPINEKATIYESADPHTDS